jgi:RIO kinase 1
MAIRLYKKKRPPKEVKMLDPENKIENDVFDRQTLIALSKLQKKELFETVDFLVSKGKEANVYRGTTKENEHVAIKIYRIETSNFIHMHEYLLGDPRFSGVKKDRFQTILAWTKKEFSNLKVFYEGKIAVPKPLGFLRNILVMEFLGKGGLPFPTLDTVKTIEPKKDFDFLISEVKKIYQLGFVHADLSPYNIMVTDEGLKIIDCSQAVSLKHPKGEEFLERDVKNLINFFKKEGLSENLENCINFIKDGKPVLKGLEAIKFETDGKI